MKRFISFLLSVSLMFTLSACGSSKKTIMENAVSQYDGSFSGQSQGQNQGQAQSQGQNALGGKRLEVDNHRDYSDKTYLNIDFSEYAVKYGNVLYGTAREKDMLIAYDKERFIDTNPYGYEVSVDKYGTVVAKGAKVELTEGGLVLSAHGTSMDYLKGINVGDIVFYYYETVYVYKNEFVNGYNHVFTLFYQYLDYIETIADVATYNEQVKKINSLIPKLDEFYNKYDAGLEKTLTQELTIKDVDAVEHKYSSCELDFRNLSIKKSADMDYILHTTYEDKLYVGGWRDANTLVYYDHKNLTERNAYGYEVSVNKEGVVVDKNSLVDLQSGGFILSGHTSTATFLKDNTEYYDKITVTEGKVYIYRDIKNRYYNYYANLRNQLISDINKENSQKIPHDYQYIKSLVNKMDSLILYLGEKEATLDLMFRLRELTAKIEEYIGSAYAQLIEYDANESRGIWYYPFYKASLNDDTTKEGVIKTIERYKKAGINEISIFVYVGGECIFDSSRYKKYSKLANYNYGEYGNDFLKCFIEECHKRNILVTAFTVPFNGYDSGIKNSNPDYYQINYNGSITIEGGQHYYDICNDNLQNEVINWYCEMVTKYNFDKVEYDGIRYKDSNLFAFSNQGAIEPSKINDSGYTQYSMNKFLRQYNLSGDVRELVAANKNVRQQWLEFKAQGLTDFITKCTAKMKQIRPNLVVTAAVKSDSEFAKNAGAQDYKKWFGLSIIDEIEIMMYNNNTEAFIDIMNNVQDVYNSYTARSGISPRLSGGDMAIDFRQLYLAPQKDGYIIFSSSQYNDDLFFNILARNHHSNYLNTKSNAQEVKNAEIKDAIDMIRDYYSVRNNKSYQELIKQLESGKNYFEAINKLDDKLMKDYLTKKLS